MHVQKNCIHTHTGIQRDTFIINDMNSLNIHAHFIFKISEKIRPTKTNLFYTV
jgi:hypothetical protein